MKTWWSVPEACVWAATRDLAMVEAVSSRTTLSQLGPLGRTSGKGARASVLVVAEALPDLCRRGEIVIQGRQILKANTKPIPAHSWQRLCLRHEILWTGPGRNIRREVLIAASPGVFSPRSIWWGDLVVRRADAMRVWPPPGAASGSERPSARSPRRQGGATPIDDSPHIEKFKRQKANDPELTIRSFVLKHDAEIKGLSVEAKVRRLQGKLKNSR